MPEGSSDERYLQPLSGLRISAFFFPSVVVKRPGKGQQGEDTAPGAASQIALPLRSSAWCLVIDGHLKAVTID